MIRNRKLLLILGVWLYVLKQSVDARPQLEAFDDESGELEDEYDDRVKRIIGLGNLGNAKNVYQKGYEPQFNDETDDDLEQRDYRRAPPFGGSSSGYEKTTYPPFPGDDDDYDKLVTGEPPYSYTSTTEEYRNNNEIESKTTKPVHHRVGSWFKKQWGKTRDWFNNIG